MKTTCPGCRHAQTLSTPAHEEVRLEYCPACGMAWLNYGQRRPSYHERLEAQVRSWEAGLARRQSQLP